jgi:hypothetical protein
MWGAFLAAVIASGSSSIPTASPHVRATSGVIRSMLSDAGSSTTMTTLLKRLNASDQVIYIAFTDSPDVPTARTRFVTATGAVRFLRIEINARVAPGDRIPLLAHELQHAVELADTPDVRDDDGVRRLYQRIGLGAGPDRFETAAARTVERQVRREISGRTIHAARTPKA